MNVIKVVVYALIITMSFTGLAEAKGRSGSLKGGFPSQKRTPQKSTTTPYETNYQKPAPTTQAPNSGFGSFGAANSKFEQKGTAIPSSTLGKDLNSTAAQSNAMKAVDARSNLSGQTAGRQTTGGQATAGQASTESGSGWFRSGNPSAGTQKPNEFNGATKPQAAPGYTSQPHYNRPQQSNGLLHGMLGFMLGHSLAQQFTHRNEAPQANQTAEQNAQTSSSPTDAATLHAEDPVVETESGFTKLLRLLAWVSIIGGLVWIVRKVLGFSGRTSRSATHYSLRG